jgi:hypothetical protein
MEAQQTFIFAIGVYFVPTPNSLLVDSDCLPRIDLCRDEPINRAKLFCDNGIGSSSARR